MGGPLPKRSDQRRRKNAPAGGEAEQLPAGEPVVWTAADPSWIPSVRRWYEAQARSGQADLLAQSDVETLWLWAQTLSEAYETGQLKPALLTAWNQACRDMLVTEGARRRARVELQHGPLDEEEPAPDVTSIHSRLKAG